MEPKTPTRRSPEAGERVRDAERTKQKLLDAALTEFSAKGYSGARVGEIAARAGVNKQLISYYFGGKEGLYRAMHRESLETEYENANADVPPDELLRWYLHNSLSDPRFVRLALWQALSGETPDDETQADVDIEQERMKRRQERGEIAADVDTAALQLALMGMTFAPTAFSHTARRLFGVDIDDPEFEHRYFSTLKRILGALAEGAEHPQKGNTLP
ncbi:TetR/AcrR family transcriptional regulator [Salininema proteolyticum]|uniref:TetR/AcrR family transcriptional regulator n=1 Tax=Salininema proteolyticum TaxID=1607685 RepID=A0ABV8TTB5_9ACTN